MSESAGSRHAADDALLAARAAELGRAPDAGRRDGSVDMLVLRVAGQQVAVPVADVRAVRPPGPLAQVPGTDAVLAGLVGGHGEVLAVASLAGLLGLTSTVPAHEQWVAVLDHPTAPLGLLADDAVDIVTVGTAGGAEPADPGGLVASILRDGSLVLRTDAVLRDPRLTLTSAEPTKELPWHDA